MKDGTLYSSGGDERWPVKYQIHVQPTATRDSVLVSGILQFPTGTQLRHLNRLAAVFLKMEDGGWAELMIPAHNAVGEKLFTIEPGSRLIVCPPWDHADQ